MAAVIGGILAIGAGGIVLHLPPPVYPAVAALGALGAFLGSVCAVMRAEAHPGSVGRR